MGVPDYRGIDTLFRVAMWFVLGSFAANIVFFAGLILWLAT